LAEVGVCAVQLATGLVAATVLSLSQVVDV
jgi:hypothetical protein